MDYALVYLANRFVFRVIDFFHHWYIDGSRTLVNRFLQVLKDMDQTIALRVTLAHFFEPLWKDYSVIGRILGFVFRSGRVLLALLIYPVFGIFFVFIYLLWVFLPALTIFYGLGFFNFF